MDGAGGARACGLPVGLTVGNIQNRRARKDSQTGKRRGKAQRQEGGPEFEQRGVSSTEWTQPRRAEEPGPPVPATPRV